MNDDDALTSSGKYSESQMYSNGGITVQHYREEANRQVPADTAAGTNRFNPRPTASNGRAERINNSKDEDMVESNEPRQRLGEKLTCVNIHTCDKRQRKLKFYAKKFSFVKMPMHFCPDFAKFLQIFCSLS